MSINNRVESLTLKTDQVDQEHDELFETHKVLERKVHASSLAEIALTRRLNKGPVESDPLYGSDLNGVFHARLAKRSGGLVEKATNERDLHVQKIKEFVEDNFDYLHHAADTEMKQKSA